jgi:hypothetical protein
MAANDTATWLKWMVGLLATTAIAAVGWSIAAYSCMSKDITELKVDIAVVKTKVEAIQRHTQPYIAKSDKEVVYYKGDKK